jgi:hypothetical protein
MIHVTVTLTTASSYGQYLWPVQVSLLINQCHPSHMVDKIARHGKLLPPSPPKCFSIHSVSYIQTILFNHTPENRGDLQQVAPI